MEIIVVLKNLMKEGFTMLSNIMLVLEKKKFTRKRKEPIKKQNKNGLEM